MGYKDPWRKQLVDHAISCGHQRYVLNAVLHLNIPHSIELHRGYSENQKWEMGYDIWKVGKCSNRKIAFKFFWAVFGACKGGSQVICNMAAPNLWEGILITVIISILPNGVPIGTGFGSSRRFYHTNATSSMRGISVLGLNVIVPCSISGSLIGADL